MNFPCPTSVPDRLLLLQGPVGPYFQNLADYWSEHHKTIVKINFNAGDDFFYKRGKILKFQESPENLLDFYKSALKLHDIQAVILFGDCRPIHKTAIYICEKMNIPFYAFEEGYIRPNYITFEKGRTNGYSKLKDFTQDDLYLDAKECLDPSCAPTPCVGYGSFYKMALYAFLYFVIGTFFSYRYPHYKHHKPFSLIEGWFWCKYVALKPWYRMIDKRDRHILLHEKSKRFFLVPLQVHRDFQILEHSPYKSIEDFIREVIESFAAHALPDHDLAFKHHPLDRGFKNYRKFINEQAKKHGIEDRVRYIHEINLPKAIRHALGVVVINSTVGLSALYHDIPVKAMGTCFYDLPDITYQGSLNSFWTSRFVSTLSYYMKYRNYIINKTQILGGFYK